MRRITDEGLLRAIIFVAVRPCLEIDANSLSSGAPWRRFPCSRSPARFACGVLQQPRVAGPDRPAKPDTITPPRLTSTMRRARPTPPYAIVEIQLGR